MRNQNPLAEVFGFPVNNFSSLAQDTRLLRLCPYNNKVPSCTKSKANDPLGVCSVFDGDDIAIVCPIRFRENWQIVKDAASFFFPPETKWTTLVEVRLDDRNGQSAGNIDVVLVAYDSSGRIYDFGALEVQAVYISGNIRRPFETYMQNPSENRAMTWSSESGYPNPDYLSSSRKRLAPQLIYKGGILNAWKKKTTVALHSSFYNTLPSLPQVPPQQANLAWLVYDLELNNQENRYHLKLSKTIYTDFEPALSRITTPEPGDYSRFLSRLQDKLDEKMNADIRPDAPTLTDVWTDETEP